MHNDLIYDVGLYNGDDTAYYLHKGYRVVAVEASPVLVEQANIRFSTEIKTGRLYIEPVGIGARYGRENFWINDARNDWNSFDKNFTTYHNDPMYLSLCHTITVPVVPITDLLAKYGVPYYLKSDIEGNDLYCLEGLDQSDLPAYVSVESHRLENLLRLYELGYRQFKLIHQSDGHNNTENWVFPPGSSGPFGEDTLGDWKSIDDVAYEWLKIVKEGDGASTVPPQTNIWSDWHARRVDF